MQSTRDFEWDMPEASGTRVILVRHGRSTYNEQHRYQGSGDQAVLTEKGRNSAYQTGLALKALPIDAIYTSPLKRTQQTANELLSAISATADHLPPLHLHDKLKEICMQHWQGLTYKYVQQQFAAEYRCWKERPHQFQMTIPQGVRAAETGGDALISVDNPAMTASTERQSCFPVLDLFEQARQFWREILPRHANQTVLIVGHGGANRALMNTAMGLTPDRYHALQQSNCGISVLNFPDGQYRGEGASPPTLAALNLTTHLGKVLPKLKEGKQGLRLLLAPQQTTQRDSTQKLAEFLQPVTIDFSVSDDLDSAQKTAECMLQYHPMAVRLPVLREDCLKISSPAFFSHPAISASAALQDKPLITGLVVTCDSLIKRLLNQAIGGGAEQPWRLQLNPGTLSVIHFPSVDQQPVLQAMNIAATALLD